jgi:putative two-component system response regulator
MKKHTTIGYDALRITERKLGESSFLRHALEIAASHHERWDGAGYPKGLAGADIPVAGRLMAVADVYDALVSKRVYKPPMPHPEAVGIIAQGRGTQFDPDVVDAFLELAPVFRNIARTFADYAEERHLLEESNTVPVQSASGFLRRVLLVDDNAINREIMFSQLSSSGYLVQVAENGRAALETYRGGVFDLILTDLDMPEMDGYELTANIRRLEAESGRLAPIFAITASELDLSPEKARSHGFSGYMLKPLDLDVLETKLADFRLFFQEAAE